MRKRLLGKLAVATLVAGGTLAVPGSAGAVTDSPVLAGATNPSLSSFGTSGLLVVADRSAPVNAFNTALLARATRTGTTWGKTVRLGSVSTFGLRDVALNRRGVGAVLWSRAVGGERGHTYLRLRRANGTWAPAYRIPHGGFIYADGGAVAVNARGEVAAITTRVRSRSVIMLHRPGHGWSQVRLPRYLVNPPSIAIDRRGGIHLMETLVPRGGDGTVTVAYRSPSGHWSGGRVKAGPMVEDAHLLTTPGGADTLVVGRASRRWMSTFDTEAYWSTQYSVFRRTSPKARWRQVWHRMGATELTAAAIGSRVRLIWTQFADRNRHRSPRTLRLQTRSLAKGAAVHTLGSQATNVGRKWWDWGSDFAAAAALGPRGCRVEVWRGDAAGQRYGGVLTSRVPGSRVTHPDPTPARADLQAAPVCTGNGHAFLASTTHQKVDIEDDGQYLIGGDVVVTRLR